MTKGLAITTSSIGGREAGICLHHDHWGLFDGVLIFERRGGRRRIGLSGDGRVESGAVMRLLLFEVQWDRIEVASLRFRWCAREWLGSDFAGHAWEEVRM